MWTGLWQGLFLEKSYQKDEGSWRQAGPCGPVVDLWPPATRAPREAGLCAGSLLTCLVGLFLSSFFKLLFWILFIFVNVFLEEKTFCQVKYVWKLWRNWSVKGDPNPHPRWPWVCAWDAGDRAGPPCAQSPGLHGELSEVGVSLPLCSMLSLAELHLQHCGLWAVRKSVVSEALGFLVRTWFF